MACKYRLGKNKNVKSTGYNKYYARTHTGGLVSNEELAKRMAARNTTYSEGEMRGLIIDLTALIRELAYEGRSVKIDNLGIFWVACCSKGVANLADWNQAEHLKPTTLRFTPTKVKVGKRSMAEAVIDVTWTMQEVAVDTKGEPLYGKKAVREAKNAQPEEQDGE